MEGVNCIPARALTTMEKLVVNVSLAPATLKKRNRRKVVKPDGLGIFRQKLKMVDESTHTLST